MVRVIRGNVARKKRKKILKFAKGYVGSLSRLYRPAKQAVTHALKYAFSGRKLKKRDFRYLWNARISAALEGQGLKYGQLIFLLKKSNITLNRKMLAMIAAEDPAAFTELCTRVKAK
jgi:large subunit ribosomal protein L20